MQVIFGFFSFFPLQYVSLVRSRRQVTVLQLSALLGQRTKPMHTFHGYLHNKSYKGKKSGFQQHVCQEHIQLTIFVRNSSRVRQYAL